MLPRWPRPSCSSRYRLRNWGTPWTRTEPTSQERPNSNNATNSLQETTSINTKEPNFFRKPRPAKRRRNRTPSTRTGRRKWSPATLFFIFSQQAGVVAKTVACCREYLSKTCSRFTSSKDLTYDIDIPPWYANSCPQKIHRVPRDQPCDEANWPPSCFASSTMFWNSRVLQAAAPWHEEPVEKHVNPSYPEASESILTSGNDSRFEAKQSIPQFPRLPKRNATRAHLATNLLTYILICPRVDSCRNAWLKTDVLETRDSRGRNQRSATRNSLPACATCFPRSRPWTLMFFFDATKICLLLTKCCPFFFFFVGGFSRPCFHASMSPFSMRDASILDAPCFLVGWRVDVFLNLGRKGGRREMGPSTTTEILGYRNPMFNIQSRFANKKEEVASEQDLFIFHFFKKKKNLTIRRVRP